MITAAAQNKRINLLPQEEFSASTLGRILTWALSTFRIIVILTEVVVMLAFLSRFWLDARANDLNDEIRQKSAVISASADFEKQFRDIQNRLKIFDTVTGNVGTVSQYLEGLSSYIPIDVTLSSFQFSSGSLQLRGNSASEIGIAQFIANLQGSKIFTNIALSSIGTNPQNNSQLTFGLKIDLMKGGGK
jgi:Tfp pilus assembly protein PilN